MKRTFINYLVIIILLGFQSISLQAQSESKEKRVQKFSNWQNADLKKNKKNGLSTDKAYEELLKGKTSTPIVVAVIDGGVDIYHEDLKEVIWTNTKEIPDNGIDDDNNGYIDDVHGWNFIGTGKKGSVVKESYEIAREYKRLSQKYGKRAKSSITSDEEMEYKYFLYVKEKFTNKHDFAEKMYKHYQKVSKDWSESTQEVKKYLQKDTLTYNDVKAIKAEKGSSIQRSADFLAPNMKNGLNIEILQGICAYFEDQLKYDLNPDCESRKAVGDDPDNFNDVKYGNNDVKGNKPTHGTMVAGLIAAKRNNNIGINGVADNVQIMPILVVPSGDERDKDVALAIRYATDNGAKIINMSFGKEFSPNKKETLLALEYAAAHNVLLVHAAGNDALSNDTIMHYPSAYMNKTSSAIPSFIEVGASTMYKNKKMPAQFSNYGTTTVDIFAPGEDIYTTYPENTYEIASGTSFSSPLVSGVAALIWSYYPKLTAKQVKEIIIASGVSYADKKVLRPCNNGKAPKIKFGQLSISGKLVNVYNALKLAETYTK
jgi:subtilisin family serine protease